ncbi:MAG: FmdE family protein [Lentisphaeria bacterium]
MEQYFVEFQIWNQSNYLKIKEDFPQTCRIWKQEYTVLRVKPSEFHGGSLGILEKIFFRVANELIDINFTLHLQYELKEFLRCICNAVSHNMNKKADMTYQRILEFHGHECPGIAIGYRMATAALTELAELRAEDEELVAIVENDACGVDAVQCLTGCTAGKGNLIFRDYGKQVYTLYSRQSRLGVRVCFDSKRVPDGLREQRERFTQWILSAPAEAMLSIEKVTIDEPDHAKIRKSISCAFCGEDVMSSRVRQLHGKPACIPCWMKYSADPQFSSKVAEAVS